MSDEILDPSGAARLYSVARTLTGALTASDVANAVFSHVQDIGASATGLWLVAGDRVRFVAGAGDRVPAPLDSMPVASRLPAAEAVRTGRIITYGSPGERDERWPDLAGFPTRPGATAVLPLTTSARTLGCLHVIYPEPMTADDFELPFLAGLAEICAAALDRAQLHDAIEARQSFLLDVSTAVANAGSFSEAVQRLAEAGETLGAITLVSSGSGRRFEARDLSLAEDLAYRVADVVAAARRREREHEVAHVLQGLLLPERLPEVEGLEMCARYLTALKEAEAGGDFYDALVLPSGRVGFVIGDVEGHDAVAAAIMGQLRSAMRALAGQVREPNLLIDALRWSWDLLGFERMATCLVGRIDPADGSLVVCSAGQPPPLVVDAGGRARVLDVPRSPPLGAPAGPTELGVHVLEPGATLFLYTDGLVEGSRDAIDMEMRDLLKLLDGTAELPPADVCDRMLAGRPGDPERPDDIALLVIRRTRAGSATELALPFELSAVGTARSWIRSQLADWSEEGRSAAALVVSELVANVVLHARSESVLTLYRHGSSCRIEVADREPRLPTLKQYSDEAPTGRGLRLVGMLSMDWGIGSRPDGKVVWADLTDAAWPRGGAGHPGPPAASGPGPDGASVTDGYEVRLLGVPVKVLRETQEHHDEVVRELAFVTESRHISARLHEVAAEVEEHFGEASEGLRSEIGRAVASGEPTVDLRVVMSQPGWAALQNLIDLLDEVDEHCERMEMLTLASSPSIRRLRSWYASEVRRQTAGERPVPWAEYREA